MLFFSKHGAQLNQEWVQGLVYIWEPLFLNCYKKLNIFYVLKYFTRKDKSVLIVIYHLIAFNIFGKQFFIIFTTLMNKSFHFIGILSQNLYILIKSPWANAHSVRAWIRPCQNNKNFRIRQFLPLTVQHRPSTLQNPSVGWMQGIRSKRNWMFFNLAL